MTILKKPLSRIIEVAGYNVIVTIYPADNGIMPHLSLRMKGAHSTYKSFYLEPPSEVKP